MQSKVLTFKFLSLCSLTFLALCNVSTFYNFHLYLLGIGIDSKKAGFLIGLYPLTGMFLYATMSQRINLGNAYRLMFTGIMIVAGCSIAYTFTKDFWSLALVRMLNGAGLFMLMASCMVVLVSIIPAEQSGRAFSIYSVALLAPYSIMPAVSEMIQPLVSSPTTLYMLTGLMLLPSAFLLQFLQVGGRALHKRDTDNVTTKNEESHLLDGKVNNVLRKPVLSILLVNGIYFTLFSGLFYLFAGFAVSKNLSDPGFFFTIQMGVMVAIRLLGGKIFDIFSKVVLVSVALLITGIGFLLLYFLPAWAFTIALVFGIGMGLCIPPLNSLMYLVSKPKYRGYNANMMMLAVHFGSFSGPFLGALVIDGGGYELFMLLAALMTMFGALFFAVANPARDIGSKGEGKLPETTAKQHC